MEKVVKMMKIKEDCGERLAFLFAAGCLPKQSQAPYLSGQNAAKCSKGSGWFVRVIK